MDFNKIEELVESLAASVEAAGSSANPWAVADALDRMSINLGDIGFALNRIADGLFAIADKDV